MLRKQFSFFLYFIILVSAYADGDFKYLFHKPFVVNYKGVDVPLLGNGGEIRALLGEPVLEGERNGDRSMTGLDEYAIKYGNYFVFRYHPVTNNILYITSNSPEITLMGKKVIGIDLETFLMNIEFKFEDEFSDGHYRYIDFGETGDYLIPGLEFIEYRDVEGCLQLTLVVEEGKITRIYMLFSEYAP
jgi:hypothetical protein